MSRDRALTGRVFGASLMLGYVCQPCWIHDEAGKANLLRPTARACLYVGPSEEARGQLVYDFDHNQVFVVRAVSLGHDPSTVSFVRAS